MSEVTDYWCEECGSHADVIEDGIPLLRFVLLERGLIRKSN